MKVLKKYTLGAFACLSILSSCGSDSDSTDPNTDYDRQTMLANYAESLIVPAYSAFQTKVEAMSTAVDAFVAAPSTETLATARTAYLEAYRTWQEVSVYEFGPAEEQMLRERLNKYPTTTSQIENNIASGSYDLQTTANMSAIGFPALDYLLYTNATDAEVVALYTSDANAANRKKYLQDVSSLVKQRTAAVYNGWTSGDYAATFKNSPGTAVGSAVGNLVNGLNSDIDITKRYKVGTPAGKYTIGNALPDKVEAYYSQNSLELLKQNIRAEKAIFMGLAADGTNGPGLDDYLDHVKAPYQNGLLSDAIEAQFDAALAAANAIQGPLSEAVISQPAAVMKVYDELQKLIVLTKTDMPAALGVTISYNDNDGD
ncbi:imelysin family protein [Pontibacter anaerobius]|uniref:Imelysin family protein n=1 Tax=Pontibacter anaerobius TaxID=2993940 RepID=A0ABT3RKH4_9BACT|nr:imelysin family protein [Pontibacter anaerobius]MCX2742065.1 imelysin family protein [Pontibacter anaerobius]